MTRLIEDPVLRQRYSFERRDDVLIVDMWVDPGGGVTPHAYRNRSSGPAHIVCEARPPSTLQEFLEAVAGLSRAGAITRAGLPRTPKGAVQAAVVAHHHRDMVRLGFPLPPPLVLAP